MLTNKAAELIEMGQPYVRGLRKTLRDFFSATGILWSVIAVEFAGLIYLAVNFVLPGRVSAGHYLYILQPALWLSLALLAWTGWRFGLVSRPRAERRLILTILVLALLQVALLAFSGLLLGYGHSPYARRWGTVLANIWYLATLLLGTEMLRAYLSVRFTNSHPGLTFLSISLLFTVLRIPTAFYSGMTDFQSSLQLFGEQFLPALAQNMLATLLVILGGPLASMLYFGVIQLFEWLSPILPNPGWFVLAVLNTIVPALSLVIVHNQFLIRHPEAKPEMSSRDQQNFSWGLLTVFILIVVGFGSGLFGIHPSLIGSGSMSPRLAVGDIVVAREVPAETIVIGDVISFRSNDITVVHRVVDIQDDPYPTTFITRGDANDTTDPPVSTQAYKGKVIFTIPKIGWVSIVARNLMARIL